MQESFLQNKVFQMVVRLIVALSFMLFTAYQVYLFPRSSGLRQLSQQDGCCTVRR